MKMLLLLLALCSSFLLSGTTSAHEHNEDQSREMVQALFLGSAPPEAPACGRLYSPCIFDQDCCSRRCGGFGQRACIKKEWQ